MSEVEYDGLPSQEEDKDDVGPLKNRGCTDIICLLIFILFLGGMGVVAYFAFAMGDPWRILNGYDSFGNTCGTKNIPVEGLDVPLNGLDLTDKPYLFYFDFTVMLPTSLVSLGLVDGTGGSIETTMMVCVKECPTNLIWDPLTTPLSTQTETDTHFRIKKYHEEYNDGNGNNWCQYDTFENNFNIASALDRQYVTTKGSSGPCPDYVLPSSAVLSRCIPLMDQVSEQVEKGREDAILAFIKTIEDKFNGFFGTDVSATQVMTYAMSDLMHSYQELAIMCGTSLVISFIIILLLGWVAQIVIYVVAIAAAVACIAGPAYFWYVWYKANEEYKISDLKLESTAENVKTLMIYAIIITVVCLIVLLLIIFLRSRIGLMVTLFKEAGVMVMRMITIVFTPLVLALFIMAWAALWTFVSGFLYTSGEATPLTFTRTYLGGSNAPDDDAANITMVYFKDHEYINYVWLYHLFGLYWGTEFFLACHEMAIAGAFVQFYWTRDKSKVHFPVVRGIWWVFRYHLGTVAFGSCIIAIIQLLRTILAYIQNKTKDSQSELVKYLLMCLQCCMWCFEKVMKFINRNAYIYTAFKGSAFCTSCKRVFALLLSNVVRVGVINCVGAFILFMGKFLVVMVTGMIGYFIMQNDKDLYYWAIPVLIASIFAFAVAHTFFSVYEIGIDTIFICFAEDEMINDGTPGREYYMSKNLMEWVNNSGEALKNLKRKKKQQQAQAKAAKSGDAVQQGMYPDLDNMEMGSKQ